MSSLLFAIVPVWSIVLIGFIASRTLTLENQTLAQLTLYILVPALIIDSLYHTSLSFNNAIRLLAALYLTSLILYLLVWSGSKIFVFPGTLQQSLVATTLFPNNGNMGIPLVTFALGEMGLERGLIYTIGSSILLFGFGPALLQGGGIVTGLKTTLKTPLLWAMIAGLGLRLMPFEQLPLNLDLSIELLGKASIPVALIILGMQLATTPFEIGVPEAFAAMMRLLVAPGIAFFVGYFLRLETLDWQVLVLQSGMPTAVNAYILTTEFGGDSPWVARTILMSTLMSFVTISLILWIFSFF